MTRNSTLWAMLGFVLMAISLFMVFVYAPMEREMGVIQRIFYFHVPLAWVSFLAFFIVFVGSILYLWKKETRWDILAHSAAEIGVVFTTLVLITGPLWARPIWGAWWVWDARLTTELVLWFIYVGYLMVRSFASHPAQAARLAAVVGIVGFVDVPIIALAIVLWRTQHPGPLVWSGGLAPPMFLTLMVSLVTVTYLFFLMMAQRVAVSSMEEDIEKLKESIRGYS
ncbi:MAG: cytochrome c biogenesis protein CcsA [Chloroflexi bacterium]|nr:cytochrome c biogenesis protein CcsA [Chloroflexota bacterium]